ncbi:MAG: LON peptidase substrate-binding domain-containing protein [Myxococcales bacterium]|nr:LON peptidase substrate-binding domain-containing protein [Myxococcales bacterium]
MDGRDDRASDPPGLGALPAAALEALPVFPLPGIVLLPGAFLPLHIFEPRYRAMLADCLAGFRCLAMAFAYPESKGSEAQPRIARVAGVGGVVHHAPLQDGRSNVVLRGLARVALDELPFVPPYRRAHASVLRDVDTPVSDIDRLALHGAAAAFAMAARETDFALPSGSSPGAIADLCAHHLIADPGRRQRVLEELDVARRVQMVTAMLAEQTGQKRRPSERPD